MNQILYTILFFKISLQVCLPGCLKCTSDDICQLCDFYSNYFLQNGFCQFMKKADNCKIINLSGSCYECETNYYLSNKICLPITSQLRVLNCEKYDKNIQCIQCESQYYLNNNECIVVENIIQNCEYYTANQYCSQCKSGYLLSYETNQCIEVNQDLPNCLYFSYYKCIECVEGYFQNPNLYIQEYFSIENIQYKKIEQIFSLLNENRKDIMNISLCEKTKLNNCSVFNSSTSCKVCNDGYYLDDYYKCQPFPQQPIQNCYKYSTLTECQECIQGYGLTSNYQCVQLEEISQCITYDKTTSQSICLECQYGYYLLENSCIVRMISNQIQFCQTLDPYEDLCNECNSGYVLSIDKIECRQGVAYCAEYEDYLPSFSTIQCKQCKDGYYLNDQKCYQGSDKNCQKYSKHQDYCIECKNMYYLSVKGDTAQCLMQPYIEYCDQYDLFNKGYCSKCIEGKFNLILDRICSFKKFIDYCIKYLEESGNLKCIECKSEYKLIDDLCIPNSIPNCAIQGFDNICEKCTDNFVLFPVGNEADYRVSCVQPFEYQFQNCKDSIQITDHSIMSQLCNVCNDFSIPFDISQNYACIKTDYLGIKNIDLKMNELCLKYKGKNCQLCDFEYFLSEINGEWKCVEICQANQSILTIEIVKEIMESEVKFVTGRRNICINKENENLLLGVNLQNQEDVEYIPIKCSSNTIQVIDLYEEKYSNVETDYINQNWIVDINQFTYKVYCPVLSAENYINGIQYQNDQSNFVENCLNYIKLNDNSYGCFQCKYGYKGMSSNEGYLSSCKEMTTCKFTRSFQGLQNPFSSLISCNQCLENQEIPFLFISKNEQEIKYVNFTLNDSIFLYTGKTGTNPEYSLQCIDNTKEQVANLLNIDVLDNIILIPNCAFYIINLYYSKSNFFNTSLNSQIKSKLIECIACLPGYQKNSEELINSCTVIENCDEQGQTWVNACSQCQDQYAYFIQNDKKFKFDQCVLTNVSNCFATEIEGKCTYCKSGYFLNYQGFCEIIEAPQCLSKKFAPYLLTSQLSYALYYQEFGVGCNKCETDYIAIHVKTVNLPYLICLYSKYLAENWDILENSRFVKNCKNYQNVIFNCQIFDFKMQCYQCKDQQTLDSTQQQCIDMSQYTNCILYDSKNFNCKECDQGYGNIGGYCELGTDINCLQFNSNIKLSSVTCFKCKEGYFLNSDKICVKGNVINCVEYEDNVNKCRTCKSDYFLIDQIYLKGGSSVCLNKNPSLICKDAFIFPHENGARIICDSCQKEYAVLTFLGENDIKSKCISVDGIDNCFKYDLNKNLYSSSFKCLQCIDGYYLSNDGAVCNKRVNLTSNCSNYFISQDQCKQCLNGFYYDDNDYSCKINPIGIINCLQYVSASQCIQCNKKNYLNKNKCYQIESSQEIQNCLYYGDQYTCSECEQGYFLNSNTCKAVNIPNCLIYEDVNICAECEDGYGLNNNNNLSLCQIVTKQNCLEINQKTLTCSVCNQGFYTDTKGNCQTADVINNCLKYTSKIVCSQCDLGYALSLDGKTCIYIYNSYDQNCKQVEMVEPLICSMCQPGYKLSEGKCEYQIEIESDDGCFTRNLDDLSECLLCKRGYYMKKDLKCHLIVDIRQYYVEVVNSSILLSVLQTLIFLYNQLNQLFIQILKWTF